MPHMGRRYPAPLADFPFQDLWTRCAACCSSQMVGKLGGVSSALQIHRILTGTCFRVISRWLSTNVAPSRRAKVIATVSIRLEFNAMSYAVTISDYETNIQLRVSAIKALPSTLFSEGSGTITEDDQELINLLTASLKKLAQGKN